MHDGVINTWVWDGPSPALGQPEKGSRAAALADGRVGFEKPWP